MSRDINPYALRLPPLVKSILKDTAHDDRRSLNAEIVSRLVKSLKADGFLLDEKGVGEISKIYEVQPGVSTKVKFNERFTKKGVDNEALAIAIESGERYLEENKQLLTLEKRALLFAIIYDLVDSEEPDALTIDNKTIDMLLKLAS